MNLLELEALAAHAAREAGRVVRARPADLGTTHKGAVDLVTAVDLASEARIRELLAPSGIPVHAEEGGGAAFAPVRWLVDPLDGTTNYVHGFPSYAVSIGLEERGRVVVGVVLDGVTGVCHVAHEGAGSRGDGLASRVSSTDDLGQALVASGFAYDRRTRADWYLAFVKVALERTQGFRRAGAAAMDLVHVACGRLDAYWEFNLQPWDLAAGSLLVTEAGGTVSDVDGGPFDLASGRILASNGRVHEALAGHLAEVLRTVGPPK